MKDYWEKKSLLCLFGKTYVLSGSKFIHLVHFAPLVGVIISYLLQFYPRLLKVSVVVDMSLCFVVYTIVEIS